MNIEIWSVGKENEQHIEVGVLHYFKKIKPYAAIQLEIIQIPKSKLSQDAEKNKQQDGQQQCELHRCGATFGPEK